MELVPCSARDKSITCHRQCFVYDKKNFLKNRVFGKSLKKNEEFDRMTCKEILELESTNTNCIYLHYEGTFLRAYERSAYFASAQQRMLDIIRERETLIESMPSGWFVRNKNKIEYSVISSEVTQNIITSRREDNIELFS